MEEEKNENPIAELGEGIGGTITFDRFVRGVLWVVLFVVVVLLLRHLSGVLIPFFVAWIMAYMIYPVVLFFQYKCRLRNRVLCIALALLALLLVITGIVLVTIPPAIAEFMKLKGVAISYFTQLTSDGRFGAIANELINKYISDNKWVELIQNDNVVEGMREALSKLFNFLYGTVEIFVGFFTVFATLLYLFFILYDYEEISNGWLKFIPSKSKPLCQAVANDVKQGMSAYFRGQALVAFCVGVLFSIGFLIIDFPMAVAFGMFIGLLNMVPYLQLTAFIPTIMLSMIESADRGEGFWGIFLAALAVFCVVQVIQDMILTPRIMGKAMGLNPATIFLSLSVWGSLLGFIGLVIALPLTNILISYYKQVLARYDRRT